MEKSNLQENVPFVIRLKKMDCGGQVQLFYLFGRKAGSLEGYTYSEALLKSEIIWSAETIARLFTDGPDIVTPGTKMPIQRMKNKRDRDDLISYLKIATKN